MPAMKMEPLYQQWFDAIDELCTHQGVLKFARQTVAIAKELRKDSVFNAGFSPSERDQFDAAVAGFESWLNERTDLDPSTPGVTIMPDLLKLTETELLEGNAEAFIKKLGALADPMLRIINVFSLRDSSGDRVDTHSARRRIEGTIRARRHDMDMDGPG